MDGATPLITLACNTRGVIYMIRGRRISGNSNQPPCRGKQKPGETRFGGGHPSLIHRTTRSFLHITASFIPGPCCIAQGYLPPSVRGFRFFTTVFYFFSESRVLLTLVPLIDSNHSRARLTASHSQHKPPVIQNLLSLRPLPTFAFASSRVALRSAPLFFSPSSFFSFLSSFRIPADIFIDGHLACVHWTTFVFSNPTLNPIVPLLHVTRCHLDQCDRGSH